MKVRDCFLIVGCMAWGKGKTLKEAKKNHKKNIASWIDKSKLNQSNCKAYLVTDDTFVDDIGYINYPEKIKPVEIEY